MMMMAMPFFSIGDYHCRLSARGSPSGIFLSRSHRPRSSQLSVDVESRRHEVLPLVDQRSPGSAHPTEDHHHWRRGYTSGEPRGDRPLFHALRRH